MRKGNVVARIEETSGTIDALYSKPTNKNRTVQVLQRKRCINLQTEPSSSQELVELLESNADLFIESDLELGKTDAIDMKLDTGDHPLIRLKPYRTALKQQSNIIVDDAIDGMLKANIIKPSKSQWSFPVVIVDKKDGSKRVCVDFRRLNQITKKHVWPLPHIDDILTSFEKANWYSHRSI